MCALKKITLAILALQSSVVFAGTMGSVCAPGSVNLPCQQQAWVLDVQALYLKPNFNNHAAYLDVNAPDHYQDWGWGFQLTGAYHFNTGNDLNLNWMHYRHSTDYTPTVTEQMQWDAINFDFGQKVEIVTDKSIRFFSGLQFARLEDRFINNTDALSDNGHIQFNGFGPRVGLNLSYDSHRGLSLYGNMASTLLVGRSQFSSHTATATQSPNPGGGVVVTLLPQEAVMDEDGSLTTIVPQLDARLGASYTYSMAQGHISLDAGYLWLNYFNVFNNAGDHTDIGFNGPYVGLKYVGNL